MAPSTQFFLWTLVLCWMAIATNLASYRDKVGFFDENSTTGIVLDGAERKYISRVGSVPPLTATESAAETMIGEDDDSKIKNSDAVQALYHNQADAIDSESETTDQIENVVEATAPTEAKADNPHTSNGQDLIGILDSLGVDHTMVPDSLLSDTWSKAKELYYSHTDGPVILGLDRCEEFRRMAGTNARIGMAGLFNAGTNALAQNLIANLGVANHTEEYKDRNMFYSHGIHSEVPWWKHNPIVDKYRDNTVGAEFFLPVVMVRYPPFWSQSTCQNYYTLRWRGQKRKGSSQVYCPDNSTTSSITYYIRNVKHPIDKVEYDSFEHIWNDFHSTYLNATFPRLIVRFEDALFFLPQLIKSIGDCVGAYSKQEELVVQSDYAKKHGGGKDETASSLLQVMLKAANYEKGMAGLDKEQLELMKARLDPELLRIFNYRMP